VAKRLAQVARHVVLGEPGPAVSGPIPVSATTAGAGEIAVSFTGIEGRLVAYSYASPIAFELCADGPGTCRFVPVRMDGSQILLSVPAGMTPSRVRYCWADSPVCTLADSSGLPAVPFELPIVSAPAHLSSEQDHERMMKLLHIDALRRGPDGDPESPKAANFDESKVKPFRLPDPLKLNNGQRVSQSETWWNKRRPQIVEAFDSEIYGRVPLNVPKVMWSVSRTTRETVADVPVLTKELTGHVDNSGYPLVNSTAAAIRTGPTGPRFWLSRVATPREVSIH
jgi:hypothetical protein